VVKEEKRKRKEVFFPETSKKEVQQTRNIY